MQVVHSHALPLHYLQLGDQALAGRHNIDCCTSAAVVSLKIIWKNDDELLTFDFVFLPSVLLFQLIVLMQSSGTCCSVPKGFCCASMQMTSAPYSLIDLL